MFGKVPVVSPPVASVPAKAAGEGLFFCDKPVFSWQENGGENDEK